MRPSILMIGTSRKGRGGIATVVNGYLSSELNSICRIKYISTHCDGNNLVKIIYAFGGYAYFVVSLILFRPCIIHIHGASRASFYRKMPLIILARIFRKGIIYHHHGGGFMQFYNDESGPSQKAFIRWVLRKTDMVLVLSEQWKNNFLTIDQRLSVTVLPNSITVPKYIEHQAKRNNKIILFMGRIERKKGLHDLIEAGRLLANNFSFKIILCGEGNISMWQDECNNKGLKDIVQFRGWVSGEEKELLFRETDIYVLPSYSEGLPMSILEAMSYGIPVISTPVGGIPEAIIDGINGFLVDPGDVHGLADKLEQLIIDDKLRKKMGITGRQFAIEKFDISNNIHQLMDIYAKLL